MTVGDALRALAAAVDAIDETGVEVVAAAPDETREGEVLADLRVRVPTETGADSASSDEASADAPPGGRADAPPNERAEASTDASGDASTDERDADADDAPGVACTVAGCTEQFDTEHGMRIHRSKTHDRSAVDDREALEAVYEAHDTFAAMREALDVDVSVQTVRRRMIDHGIHAPGDDLTTKSTGDAAPESAETDATERADGPALDVDLPPGVSAADLRAAVEEATTLYEVQRRLDLDRAVARELLSELGLLELVHGRVADQHRREELKQGLEERFGAPGGHAESSSD